MNFFTVLRQCTQTFLRLYDALFQFFNAVLNDSDFFAIVSFLLRELIQQLLSISTLGML